MCRSLVANCELFFFSFSVGFSFPRFSCGSKTEQSIEMNFILDSELCIRICEWLCGADQLWLQRKILDRIFYGWNVWIDLKITDNNSSSGSNSSVANVFIFIGKNESQSHEIVLVHIISSDIDNRFSSSSFQCPDCNIIFSARFLSINECWLLSMELAKFHHLIHPPPPTLIVCHGKGDAIPIFKAKGKKITLNQIRWNNDPSSLDTILFSSEFLQQCVHTKK